MKNIILKGRNLNSNIHISEGLFARAGEICLKDRSINNVCIMTDSNVSPLYLNDLENSFPEDMNIISLNIPAGEEYKHHLTVEEIYKVLADSNFDRSGMIIALGGGVIGDMAGFVAATFLRGVKYFVQIPTTLLAQVDSSIGGKCGVDLPQGKNMVGVFRQPDEIIIDVKLLKTLEKREFACGMAEILKYGLVKDETIIADLEGNDHYSYLMENKNINLLEDLVCKCINIKKIIVEEDEFDMGERKLLNFGHTIGHSIEKLGGYTAFRHGEAVALGIIGAIKLGMQLKKTNPKILNRIKLLLEKLSLPITNPYNYEEIYSGILSDKKIEKEEIVIPYITDIGEASIMKISMEDFYKNLKICFTKEESIDE